MVTDLNGYVRGSLGVKDDIFNVFPIAKALKVPEEELHKIRKSWSDDFGQLEVILKWLKENDVFEDFVSMKEALEGLKQGSVITPRKQLF